MTGCNRREEYWRFYDHAVVSEASHLRRTLIQLVREKPCPRLEGSNRGRPQVHSKEKLDFACLWMVMAHNQMHCRGRPDGQPPAVRQGYRAIAWNVRVLNWFEWANRLKVPIPSYGGQQMRAECA